MEMNQETALTAKDNNSEHGAVHPQVKDAEEKSRPENTRLDK